MNKQDMRKLFAHSVVTQGVSAAPMQGRSAEKQPCRLQVIGWEHDDRRVIMSTNKQVAAWYRPSSGTGLTYGSLGRRVLCSDRIQRIQRIHGQNLHHLPTSLASLFVVNVSVAPKETLQR